MNPTHKKKLPGSELPGAKDHTRAADAPLAQALDPYFAAPSEEAILRAKAHLIESLAEAKNAALLYGHLQHPITGSLFLVMRSNKVIALDFGLAEQPFLKHIEQRFGAPLYYAPEATATALSQVQAYLDRQRMAFDLPIDLSLLTRFQRQVLEATQQIPRGRVTTYLEIAKKIGKPQAARAVGRALGSNPIPIVIPCHRVIASDGSLRGYSGGGGLETKRKLLQLEGAQLI